jgi:Predicted metal-dependent enzyme
MKYSGIGGQAVIEGIMMRNKDNYSVGVRKPNGEIEVTVLKCKRFAVGKKFISLPFIRGIFGFIDSLVLGMKALTISASYIEDDENVKNADKPKKVSCIERIFGDKAESVVTGIVMVFSMLIAVSLFMLIPYAASLFLRPLVGDAITTVLEGLIRFSLFVGYILLISRMEDIRRNFMYHGAEHKCINCIESGMELNVENVKKSSKQHKRCGTSFIFFVMIVSSLIFMLIKFDTLILNLAGRIILMPVIAGISYELIMLAGRSDNKLVVLLSKPGMWLQNLTTKEPDDSMIEVAISAVDAVFDWKTYYKENFANIDTND